MSCWGFDIDFRSYSKKNALRMLNAACFIFISRNMLYGTTFPSLVASVRRF